MIGTKQSEVTLKRLVDEREGIHRKHESKLADVNSREDPMPTTDERELLKRYRDELADFDSQILELSETVEKDRLADDKSREIRRALEGAQGGFEVDGDGNANYDFNTFAFDYFITRTNVREAVKISKQWGVTEDDVMQANQRLDLIKRVNNTLSSNIGGLTPPQHIAQIFQVIDKSRNLVNASTRADLERGTLTYPVITTPPVVAVQASEKTQGGDVGMVVDMVTKTATTYHGGGDLSWQAINWSTPNALRLWFDLVAADYALKTETDAATIVSASAFLNNIGSPIASTPTFAQFMTAVGAGYTEVWTNSGRTANTLIMAPDRYGYVLGTTSDAFAQFTTVSNSGVGPLNIVVSRGLNSGEIIVGDVSALLCAETPGAPVEMNVIEPAIGGVEVGLIGAFEAAVVDDGAFALITTAS